MGIVYRHIGDLLDQVVIDTEQEIIENIYEACRYAFTHKGNLEAPELDSILKQWKRGSYRRFLRGNILSVILISKDGEAEAVCQLVVHKRSCSIVSLWGADLLLREEILRIIVSSIKKAKIRCVARSVIKDRELFKGFGFEFPEIRRVKVSYGILAL